MDIKKLLNTTLAGQIAQILDANDNNKDGKISGSIWNQFVNDIGTGKQINENGFISIENAMKSITTYAVRMSKQAGKEIDTVAKEWLAGYCNASNEDSEEDGVKNDRPEQEDGRKGIGGEPHKYSTDDIKLKIRKEVYIRDVSPEAMQILEATKEGKALRSGLKQGKTDGLTKDNVAYALGDTMFGPNSQKQAQYVFQLLTDKLDELGLLEDGKDYFVWDSVKRDLNYKQINQLFQKYKERIITAQNKIVNNADAKKAELNNTIPLIQEGFDKANKVLVDIANNPNKAKITVHDNKHKSITLENGLWISVRYDDKGEIIDIRISHTVTQDKDNKGNITDGAEVRYTPEKAEVVINSNGEASEYHINDYKKFEKLKEIAKAIFG